MAELPETARQKLKHWVAGPHPDANLLAAFAENSLTTRERGLLIEHLAACASCREVMALAAPPEAPATVAPAPEPTVRQWAMMRWGTAAAILVVMVGVVWIGRTTKTAAPKPAAEMARAMPESANQMTPEEKAKAEPQESAGAAAAVARPQAAQNEMKPARPRAGKEEAQSDRLEAVHPQSGLKKDDQLANAPVAAETAPTAPAAKKAPPMSELPSLARTAPSSAAAALDRVEPKTLSAANEQAPAAAPAPASRQAMQAGAVARAQGVARWSIAGDGSLQRSMDEGRSWQQELAESGTVFRAVSAVGSEIWAGGNRGILYHSGDGGGSWTKVTPAAGGSALVGDIVRINFADGQRGSLTTSGGQTWLTTDGGRTWALR